MYSVCKFRNISFSFGKKFKEVLNFNYIILYSYNIDFNEI